MRISRLALTEIRRHRRYELHPAPGLTVIRGPNESGKSTLQLALELVLFRRATTTAAEIATVRSWDAEADPMIELEFDLDGKPGRLAKRFAGAKGSVRLELDGVVDTDPGRVDQLLAAATGIPSEKFLRSTASVRHFEMDDLDRDERALRDRLQQSIGGGDVGASKARQRLAERIAKMRATGAKNPGPLRVLNDEIAALSTQLRDGEAALDRLSRDRAVLAAATADRAALEAEVKATEAELAEAETAARVGAERQTVTERYDHLRRAADLAERLSIAEAAPPTTLPLTDIVTGVERLRALELETAQLAAARAAVVAPIVPPEPVPAVTAEEIEPPAPPPPAPRPIPVPPAGPGLVIAGVLLLLSVAAVTTGFAQGGFPQFLGVLLAAGALVSAGLVFRRDRMIRAARAQLLAANEATAAEAARAVELAAAAQQARLAAARAAADADARRVADAREARRVALIAAAEAARQRGEIDARATAVATETTGILAALGVADRPAAEALLVAAQRHAATVDGVRAELRGLLGTDVVPPIEELRRERDEAARKAEMGGHALVGMGPTGADPESARLRAQAALRSARTRLQTAVGEQGQAEGRVSQNPADAEAVAAIAERLAAAHEELARQERRLRIYQQTLDAITTAEAATMQKAARFLERRMGTDIARITGGRYDRVRVDENDLAITVWSPERAAWVDATQLSKGTADQLYLAARLGLVRQVTQDRRPPLVFDDPFVTFDDDRALRAMAVLKELAADHQVLYLTCSDRYDAAADLVVELPAPAIVHVEPGTAVPEPPVREEPFALTLSLDLPTSDA